MPPVSESFEAPKAAKASGSWDSLPVEVRLMILDEVSKQKYRGWASCAAVCKEWQGFIERKNFHRLILRVPCLDELESMVVRQRHLIQYICLDIELPRYTCRDCPDYIRVQETPEGTILVRASILKLFLVLSTWQPTGRLTLELNAHSPSDSEHWFKNYHFALAHEDGGDLAQQSTRWHDPNHGWDNGQQIRAPPVTAIARLFHPICRDLSPNLPQVRAVTGLVIRRQLRRQILPAGLRRLWKRLPRLESIVYEPWRFWDRMGKTEHDEGLASVIQNFLPSRVRAVSIFEDFNDQFAVALRGSGELFSDIINMNPVADLTLVRAFASKSRDLEHLSVSYMIDARQFFNCCQASYTWQNLQSLTLTSSILTPKVPEEEIFILLHDASSAALNMPQLECMVFWNSQHEEACAVIYERKKGSMRATLTWRGTWNLEFDHNVVESWQKVASDSYLQTKNELIRGTIKSHGDAIYYLRLPDRVIDSGSLWHIRREGILPRMT